jgi:hypothetical protein
MVSVLSTTSGAFCGGIEAALQLRNRNRSYEDSYQELGERDARVYESEAFRRGYERGLRYLEAFSGHAGKTAS